MCVCMVGVEWGGIFVYLKMSEPKQQSILNYGKVRCCFMLVIFMLSITGVG